MDYSNRFMALFDGFDGAHGQTKIGEDNYGIGKQKAESRIVRLPLTVDLVKDHLAGRLGVGSVPIKSNNRCSFGAIDIDVYDGFDHKALDQKLQETGITGVVCRSKSGGAHVFFFFKKDIPARVFKEKAAELAAHLGHGGCEIFPKQDELLAERGDVGNFINLPYFNAEQTMRMAIKPDGSYATFEEFLDLAESRVLDPHAFASTPLGRETPKELKSYPPCLENLFSQGIPEGMRNEVMAFSCVVAKKEAGDAWKPRLAEINTTYCDDPISQKELDAVAHSYEKKEYGYSCNKEPFQSRCNRASCRRRKYGVGSNTQSADITSLSVLKSDPPIWFLDVDGKRLELQSTKQLQVQAEFQRACIEQLHIIPPVMKNEEWFKIVGSLLEDVVAIDVDEEMTNKGTFKRYVREFCTESQAAKVPVEINIGKPWTEFGFTYFLIEHLFDFLEGKKFDAYSKGQVQERLKEINGNRSSTQRRWGPHEKRIRVWCVPEYEEIELPEITEKVEDIPF